MAWLRLDKRWGAIVGAIALVLALGVASGPAWHAPASSDDEALLLVYPERVLSGAVPNRDYESFYGPANDWVLAVPYALAGPSVTVERDVGFAYRLLIVLAIFWLALSEGPVVALAAGLLSLLMLLPLGLYAAAWLGGIAAGLLSICFALRGLGSSEREHPHQRAFCLAAAGALAGCAVLFRFDLVFAVGLSAIPLLFKMRSGWRRWYAIGLGLPACALLVHLWLAGIGPVVQNVFVDAVIRDAAQASQRFPFAGSFNWWWLVCILGGGAVLALVGLLMGLRRLAQWPRAAALGLFGLAILSEAVQRTDPVHFASVACVTVALAPWALISACRAFGTRGGARALAAPGPATTTAEPVPAGMSASLAVATSAGAGAAAVVPPPHFVSSARLGAQGPGGGAPWRARISAIPRVLMPSSLFALATLLASLTVVFGGFALAARFADHNTFRHPTWVRNGQLSFPLRSRRTALAASAVVGYVQSHTQPGERLFVGPQNLRRTIYNDVYLYYLLPQLTPATYHLDMNPGTADQPGGRLAHDIASANVVILTNEYDSWRAWRAMMPFARLGSPAAQDVVKEDFCLTFRELPFRVYVRCPPGAAHKVRGLGRGARRSGRVRAQPARAHPRPPRAVTISRRRARLLLRPVGLKAAASRRQAGSGSAARAQSRRGCCSRRK